MRRREASEPGSTLIWVIVVAALVVVFAIVIAILVVSRPSSSSPSTSGGGPGAPQTWSAVLLSDNEVFFGHIKGITSDRIELSDVFFVQKPPTSSSGASTANGAVSIVSLVANQVQCPENNISINRSNVLYWENLQTKSFVVQKLLQLSQQPQGCYQPPTPTPSP